MDDDRLEQLLDVVGDDVVPAVLQGPAACNAVEREARAHRRPQLQHRQVAGRTHELDCPALHERVDVDLLDRLAEHLDVLRVRDWPQPTERVPVQLLVEDVELFVDGRIAERGPHEEAVELRLRQRVGAVLLDRVLGGDEEERIGQRVCKSVDSHLQLCHSLQERRLRLRERAVDLVDEHEDRPALELELTVLRVPDREARHVGGLQVRRALDP